MHVTDQQQGWVEQTRRVLTRDLLVRARHSRPGERRALLFRALHLNLPLVDEVADDLGLDRAARRALEHHALDGLYEAVRLHDPRSDDDFATFARPLVRAQLLAHAPSRRLRGLPPPRSVSVEGRALRLVIRRTALALAGYRT
jgi:DNA-directed RNA polymerase specialized sigma subunit